MIKLLIFHSLTSTPQTHLVPNQLLGNPKQVWACREHGKAGTQTPVTQMGVRVPGTHISDRLKCVHEKEEKPAPGKMPIPPPP